MPDHAPAPVRWIRILMFLSTAATLALPVWFAWWTVSDRFFHLAAAVLALPALPPLLCALAAHRPRRPVFACILATALGLLGWTFFTLSGLLQPFTVGAAVLLQVLLSAAVLVLALLPRTRAFYLRS